MWRASRLLFGRWKRLTRWEYWPTLPLYLPVLPTILWQAAKYRSLSLLTAVNPGMPSGGFVMDSKGGILANLESSGKVAPFGVVAEGLAPPARLSRLQEIITEKNLTYPVVLKPDLGERGTGVLIAHDEPTCVDYLDTATGDTIVQAHVPGVEYGVFYERFPDRENGRITGITEKATTTVTGDGESTLERLILADHRAVAQAPVFLKLQEDRLQEVIADGEKVPLNLIGTHSRGSLFLDASLARTKAMEEAIDAASKHFPGFYLGRYDIRCPSLQSLQDGGEFSIIELNGVTSEPTHMYDPRHSVFFAWKALAGQWKRAFAIAAQNRAAGHPPLPLGQLLQRIKDSIEA